MTLSKPQIEWHFNSEHEANASARASLVEERIKRNDQVPFGESHSSRENSRLYELILGAVFLYSAALFFVWQEAERNVTILEGEVVALRSEVSQIQQGILKSSGPEETDIRNSDAGLPSPIQMETEYLRFWGSERTTDLVKAIATLSNEKYRQLHQDFGLKLPAPDNSLINIVNLATNANSSLADETLIIPFSKAAAGRYGISERDVLTNEIFIRLSEHVLSKALRHRSIKPQWQAMILALKMHLQLENGHNRAWRADASLLAYRHLAQDRSINLVQQMSSVQDMQINEDRQPSPTATKIAGPLIEYILETYGYARAPALLDAFETHESWETLTLEVFNVPASEFEKSWHDFLKERYPLTQD